LDHGRLRSPTRQRAAFETIDLGNEPPLSVDGGTGGMIDRRRVSVQWFSGTILTGVCGAALMGGAVFASLDGETNFAAIPDRVENVVRSAVGSLGAKFSGTRKSDRLPPAGESGGSREVIRISTTARVGDRELVRVRPYTRVSANLSLSSSEYASSVPPFNAQKLLAQAGADGTPSDDQPGAGPDAEVSYVTRDLASVLPRAKVAAALPIDEIIARVRDTANWTGSVSPRYQLTGLWAAPAGLRRRGHADPYAGFETRIVPENITLLPKTANQATGGNSWNERLITVKKGENIVAILQELGATPDEIAAIVAALGPRGRSNGLKEGQKLRILAATDESKTRLQPVRVVVMGDSSVEAVVALSDMGKYVSVDVSSMNALTSETEDEEDDGKGIRLYQSIYETALRNQIPRPVIESLIHLLLRRDFAQGPAGRSFDVLYSTEEETPSEAKNDVMFAALSVGGEIKKYYRFQTPMTQSSTTTTRAARARRSSWCASRLRAESCGPASAPATIRCWAITRCTPASTGPPRSERPCTPPATAPSRRSAGNPATANTSASVTPTATKPPTAT
jgi:hypothetical protein